MQTLNGRLPPEDGSVRPENLAKRVSDDSQHLIFRRRNKKSGDDCFMIFVFRLQKRRPLEDLKLCVTVFLLVDLAGRLVSQSRS